MSSLKRYKPLRRYTPLRKTRKSYRSDIKSNDGFAGLTDTALEELAWKYFSIYIRKRDRFQGDYAKCVTCGKIDHWKTFDPEPEGAELRTKSFDHDFGTYVRHDR